MQTIKRYLPTLFMLLLAALPLIGQAAQVTVPSYAGGQDVTQAANNAGQSISTFLLALTGILGAIFIVWGGIQFIVNEDKSKGKNTIVYTLVGIAIGGSVGGIMRLVTG